MYKILIVFTGGTIGSSLDDKYISPNSSTSNKLLNMFWTENNRFTTDDISFDMISPYTILSENLSGNNIRELGECVAENLRSSNYDGIIVTHGTDTIQYSAAALSYSIPCLSIPILFVSSNYVLDDARANGLANFDAAVRFICDVGEPGMFVSYRNSDGIIYIHRATRLLPHLPYEDDLRSIFGRVFGVFDNKTGVFEQRETDDERDCDMIRNDQSLASLNLMSSDESNIIYLNVHPAMMCPDLEKFEISELPRAIILNSYHSGTAPAKADVVKMLDFANQHDIPVLLSGANIEADYESVQPLIEHGIRISPQASPIAMYMKIWMILESEPQISIDDLCSCLHSPIAYDIID